MRKIMFDSNIFDKLPEFIGLIHNSSTYMNIILPLSRLMNCARYQIVELILGKGIY